MSIFKQLNQTFRGSKARLEYQEHFETNQNREESVSEVKPTKKSTGKKFAGCQNFSLSVFEVIVKIIFWLADTSYKGSCLSTRSRRNRFQRDKLITHAQWS